MKLLIDEINEGIADQKLAAKLKYGDFIKAYKGKYFYYQIVAVVDKQKNIIGYDLLCLGTNKNHIKMMLESPKRLFLNEPKILARIEDLFIDLHERGFTDITKANFTLTEEQ